jgi:hypothetical protein
VILVFVYSTWNIVALKTRFETWITTNAVHGIILFNLSFLITLKAYLYSQRTPNVQIKYFVFHWSNYRLFVLNTAWKRDSLQMLIFVNVFSTWSTVQLKTRFEMSVTRNDIYGESLIHLSYLITPMDYLCPQRTPNFPVKCFMFARTIYRLFVLNTGWKTDSLQMMNIRKCLLDMRHGSNVNAFWDVNNKKWRIWYKFDASFLFNNCYGSPVLTKDTKFPNQVFYVYLDDLQTICAK